MRQRATTFSFRHAWSGYHRCIGGARREERKAWVGNRPRKTRIRPRVPFKNLAGPIPPFPIRDGHTALLVMDIHRFTASRDHGFGRMAGERGIVRELGEYYDQLDQALPKVRDLIDGCRNHRLPIVFTRIVGGRLQEVATQARVTGFWAMADSPDAEFLPGLAPTAGEQVIDRTTTSALAGQSLHNALRAQDIRYLIVCGVLANAAVEHTARDAADLGYGVIVVSDACAAETWAIHAFVMTTLIGGLIRTRTTQGVLEVIAGTRT